MSLVDDLLNNLNLWTPFKEYYSWGNAKSGQILFGTGKTLQMENNGQINPVVSQYSGGKLVKADLLEEDQRRMTKLANKLKEALLEIGVGNNNDVHEAGVAVGQNPNLQNQVVEEEHPEVQGEGVQQEV
jgi:hypothetical protein